MQISFHTTQRRVEDSHVISKAKEFECRIKLLFEPSNSYEKKNHKMKLKISTCASLGCLISLTVVISSFFFFHFSRVFYSKEKQMDVRTNIYVQVFPAYFQKVVH